MEVGPTIRRFSVASLLLLLSLVALDAPTAQITMAVLKGRVVDRDGTGLPGVPVSVVGRALGDVSRTVITNAHGAFRFPPLPPANDYVMRINYPGFAATEVGPIDLDPGKTTIQDILLRTKEELTERIEIVEHGSVVDTESTKSSTSFNTEFIEGLPIIGRNYQDILTLAPGVTDTDGDGSPNVQGARETGLQYRLDGGNITDPVTGTYGQNLNFDAIEEIEVITAGASAEYGRADGGFANIITKSGGNEFEGSFKVFWRGDFLDGDGAGENNDTVLSNVYVQPTLRLVTPYLTLGGALKKDRLWYFLSYQSLDRVDPLNAAGTTIEHKIRGRNAFAKVTWQAGADSKVALQYNDDPYRYEGLFLDFGVDEDSDATFRAGAQTTQLRWTLITSPTLLMEALLARFDGGQSITPVSPLFHPFETETLISRTNMGVTRQAVMPDRECRSSGGDWIINCDPTQGKTSIYQINGYTNIVTGPYWIEGADTRVRNALKADLTWTTEALGEHQVKAGFEFADEYFKNQPVYDPFFFNYFRPCGARCPVDPDLPSSAVEGFRLLFVYEPLRTDQRVSGFNSSAYVSSNWKPKANLSIETGLRIDKEDIDTHGFDPFDPRAEKRSYIHIVEGLCTDAERVSRTSGLSNWDRACSARSGFVPGGPPRGFLIYTMDRETPQWLEAFDRDRDGAFDSGRDGAPWNEAYSNYWERGAENFEISNLNLSPRISVAWDPWADGKTKGFATWGRYHDRLFLGTVVQEMGPDSTSYVFSTNPYTNHFEPGAVSGRSSAISLTQVDRGMKTPYTDVFSIGVERELAPEWSARVTFTQRLGWNLLQDADLNHVLCTQYDEVFGIDPKKICLGYTDAQGRAHLNEDLFGGVPVDSGRLGVDPNIPDADPNIVPVPVGGFPNDAPDLYMVNPNFNQILRIGNYNASKYRSLTLELNHRLHRNWQLQGSYTWSRAIGDAEMFLSRLGNDASTKDDERGYLDYDQKHRVVLIATTLLPHDVQLGGTVRWEGGTPYSLVTRTVDLDSVGNASFRTFYPTGRRNDQRNGNSWSLDTQVVKRFTMRRVQASAQLAVQNILNMDDVTLSSVRTSEGGGATLSAGPQGLRRFGRIWEIGLSLNF